MKQIKRCVTINSFDVVQFDDGSIGIMVTRGAVKAMLRKFARELHVEIGNLNTRMLGKRVIDCMERP